MNVWQKYPEAHKNVDICETNVAFIYSTKKYYKIIVFSYIKQTISPTKNNIIQEK